MRTSFNNLGTKSNMLDTVLKSALKLYDKISISTRKLNEYDSINIIMINYSVTVVFFYTIIIERRLRKLFTIMNINFKRIYQKKIFVFKI